jgi:DNA-binding NtrC family response regulator
VALDQETEQQVDSARWLRHFAGAVAHVRVVFGKAVREVHAIPATGTTLGRAATDPIYDLQIDDARMSRRHVRIERNADNWRLVDLGSRNGGFLDGRPFASGEARSLDDGAVIRLGDSVVIFRASLPSFDVWPEEHPVPGVSPLAAEVRRRLASLASAPGHVLVLGETGTGKERVARALADHRVAKPFVPQNCAELRPELARSELFGHVRGSFSGALATKQGLVELAGDGVLFLDEIGELSIDVQADLLRFLEDGTFRPVGSNELRRSDARVVAATNIDIDQAVATNRFRRDLAARLRSSNAPLVLSPLRDRREDIPHWASRFLREAGRQVSWRVDEAWTAGALECLLLYPWLENLRELRQVMRTLVADAVSFPCATEHLPTAIHAFRVTLRDLPTTVDAGTVDAQKRGAETAEPTRAEIEDALRQTGGRMLTAAKLLGIDRRKLYRLCERLEMSVQSLRDEIDGQE